MEKECPNCLAIIVVEDKEEGARVTCRSCSIDMRILHSELVEEAEYLLQRTY